MALFDVICEKNLIVKFLSDAMIGQLVPHFEGLRAFLGREEDPFVMLVYDDMRRHNCLVLQSPLAVEVQCP